VSNIDWKKVLEIAKKNAVSISAGVAALLAVGVVLFYVDPGFGDLAERVEEKASVRQELEQLRTQQRQDITLGGATARDGNTTLDGFPTRATIDRGNEIILEVQRGAGALLDRTVRRNRMVPLLYGADEYEEAAEAWPLSGEGNIFARDQWLRRYRSYLAVDGINADTGSYPEESLPGQLEATIPPTAESVRRAQERRRAQIEASSQRDAATGDFIDPEGVEERVRQETAQLGRGLKYNRAADHLLYLDPALLDPHPLLTATGRPDAEEIFDAQMQLWVMEQVLFTLREINVEAIEDRPAEEQNVIHAPVKHVASLVVPTSFPAGSASRSASPGGFGGSPGGTGFNDPRGGQGNRNFGPPVPSGPPVPAGPPVNPSAPPRPGGTAEPADPALSELTPVPTNASASLESSYAVSPTGRPRHNPFYDVIPFELTLRVSAPEAPAVLRRLQDGTFVTVLNVREMHPIDPVVALADGFVYGDDAVVEVDLACEIVFLREWTVPLMPESVRQALAQLAGQSPGGAAF